MLNPSTADAQRNDATVTRLIKRSQIQGYDSLEIVNLFALRATDPAKLKTHADPIGPGNDAAIKEAVTRAGAIVYAWGKGGDYLQRACNVQAMLANINKPVFTLGTNKDGSPRHPLHVDYKINFRPRRWLGNI